MTWKKQTWQSWGLMAAVLLWSRLPLIQGHVSNGHPLMDFKSERLEMSLQQNTLIKVNASEFRSGDWVEVEWSGVKAPALDDLVAVYSPADADPRIVAPVKYIWAIQSPSHVSSGSGIYRFRLVNMRKPVRFAFLRSGLSAPRLEAWGPEIRPQKANEPLQIHMALTNKAREVLMQWTSLDAKDPQVQWGNSSGIYTEIVNSKFDSYSRDDMCGSPANATGWSDPGLLHRALLTGLDPEARIFYRVGDPAFGFSEEHSFLVPPLAGPDAVVKFLAIADLGQAEVDQSFEQTEMGASLQTTERLAAETGHHQLLIHNGDISYARGFQTIWDAYWDQITPLTTKMPYMVVPGNHERDWPLSGDRYHGAVYDSGGECGVPFERRTGMPLPGKDKWWYSFDFGPIHFLQYSTEHDFAPGSEQHEFVKADLSSVDKATTPWLVVGGHRPIFVDSTFGAGNASDTAVSADLQDAFETLFFEHGVDMTWHGHHHSYQRSCALYNGTCYPPNTDGSQRAPIHLVIGHAGAGLSFTVHQQRVPFMETVQVEHGYMRVEASASRLFCEVLSSTEGRVMDTIELFKPAQQQDLVFIQ